MGDMYSGIDGGLETEELVNLFVAQKQSAKRCSQSPMVDDGMEWSVGACRASEHCHGRSIKQ